MNPFPLSGFLFPLSELMAATGKENLLGRGGYGSVYKGFLRHTVVAVKFLNEVSMNLRWSNFYCCNLIYLGRSVLPWKEPCIG